MAEKIVTLTDIEIDHIRQALTKFYDDEEHGWCIHCEEIAAKLGFKKEDDNV